MSLSLGGLLRQLSRSWRLLLARSPISCRSLRWSSRGGVRSLLGKRAPLHIGYNKAMMILIGESFDGLDWMVAASLTVSVGPLR